MAVRLVRREGNSISVTIPREEAQKVGIEQGSYVDISARDGQLVIRRVKVVVEDDRES